VTPDQAWEKLLEFTEDDYKLALDAERRRDIVDRVLSIITIRLHALKPEVVQWISLDESIPEDKQNVGFIVSCKRDDFLHGRVYGGRFMASDFHAGFGGFNTHGMSCQASHWFPFPEIPDGLT